MVKRALNRGPARRYVHPKEGDPLCRGTKNKAFLSPQDAPKNSIRAAQAMCSACSYRTQCALLALSAGESIMAKSTQRPGHRPARGVIAAGVICRGTAETGRALAQVAGVTYRPPGRPRPRTKAPRECVACHRPMVPWTRYAVPEGHVMHYARGYCTACRKAYEREAPRKRDHRDIRRGPSEWSKGRYRIHRECVACGRPLAPGIGKQPPGTVRHAHDGLCIDCAQDE